MEKRTVNPMDILEKVYPVRANLGNLSGLRKDIQERGLLEPPIVRELPSGKFIVVSGSRRVQACKDLGIEFIHVLVASNDETLQLEREQRSRMFYSEREKTAMHSALNDSLTKIDNVVRQYSMEGGITVNSKIDIRITPDKVITAHAKVAIDLMSVVDSNS